MFRPARQRLQYFDQGRRIEICFDKCDQKHLGFKQRPPNQICFNRFDKNHLSFDRRDQKRLCCDWRDQNINILSKFDQF